MPVVPSFEDLREAAKGEALARPTRLTPEIFDVEGSDVNIATAVGAAMAERVAAYALGELAALRLRTVASVDDDAVEQLAASEFAERRRGALSSIVPLLFERASSSSATTVPRDTLVGTAGGVTFVTAVDLVFAPGDVGPLEVAAVATTAGDGGNVPAESITRILSTLEDTTLSVINDEPAAGGREAETNEDVISRCETAYQRARKGVIGAIESEALVPGVVSARAFELEDGDGLTGRVVVQILGAGGTTNRALARRVHDHMRSVRAAGVPVVVVGLSPRPVSIRVFGLAVEVGYDAARVLDTARRSLVTFVDSIQIGAPLYRSQLIATLTAVEGLVVPDGALATPFTDLEPAQGEYLTTRLSLVRVTTDPSPLAP